MNFSESKYPLQKETYEIIGVCMEVHRNLGHGFLEIVYKDALEFEFKQREILYTRKKKYEVDYKGYILPHKFHADFIVYDNVILEVKATKGIAEDHYARVLNYLAASKCKIGLVVNFGEPSLQTKRIIL
ncbi:MAG: GxxExxY protein [Bacteroidales bacterium]|nr:GxxExxY protein [Bacteroidales bacterium]